MQSAPSVPPYVAANSSADAAEREPTAASSASGTSARSVANAFAILPVARMPQPMVRMDLA